MIRLCILLSVFLLGCGSGERFTIEEIQKVERECMDKMETDPNVREISLTKFCFCFIKGDKTKEECMIESEV